MYECVLKRIKFEQVQINCILNESILVSSLDLVLVVLEPPKRDLGMRSSNFFIYMMIIIVIDNVADPPCNSAF